MTLLYRLVSAQAGGLYFNLFLVFFSLPKWSLEAYADEKLENSLEKLIVSLRMSLKVTERKEQLAA